MRVKMSAASVARQIVALDRYIAGNYPLVATRFIKLGSKMLRVLVHDAAIVPQIERQLTWSLKPEQTTWDATLVVWKEPRIEQFIEPFMESLGKNNFALRARMRLEAILVKKSCCDLDVFCDNFSNWNPVVFYHVGRGYIEAVDQATRTYYYGVRDSEPEEFIKEGHIFVQFVNQIVKSPTANLAHGACVGMGGNGVLLCGTGHRGKSTLTVLAMIKGLEYVSDDYQILEQQAGQLYAYPFYSIITLSSMMYNEMYDDFKGKFVSMNARKDKYVFNIAAYHDQFRDRYPIRACLFPEIVSDPDPSIVPCSPQDKSRAIAQLTGSTIRQMRDMHSPQTIKKLADMIRDYPFYKINLCRDIYRNVECLRDFCNNLHK